MAQHLEREQNEYLEKFYCILRMLSQSQDEHDVDVLLYIRLEFFED